jgi:hypothetical protein
MSRLMCAWRHPCATIGPNKHQVPPLVQNLDVECCMLHDLHTPPPSGPPALLSAND